MQFLAFSQWKRAPRHGSFAPARGGGMVTKQTIAVLGATEQLGPTLIRKLCTGNYRLLLKGQDRQKLEQLVADTLRLYPGADVEASFCEKDSCWEADIIILADTLIDGQAIAENIRQVANQKVVIHFSSSDTISNQHLQCLLSNSKIVSIIWDNRFKQTSHAECYLEGADKTALITAAELMNTAGYLAIIKPSSTISNNN